MLDWLINEELFNELMGNQGKPKEVIDVEFEETYLDEEQEKSKL